MLLLYIQLMIVPSTSKPFWVATEGQNETLNPPLRYNNTQKQQSPKCTYVFNWESLLALISFLSGACTSNSTHSDGITLWPSSTLQMKMSKCFEHSLYAPTKVP